MKQIERCETFWKQIELNFSKEKLEKKESRYETNLKQICEYQNYFKTNFIDAANLGQFETTNLKIE